MLFPVLLCMKIVQIAVPVRKFICQASKVLAYNSVWLSVSGGYLLMVHVRVLHFARFVHLDVTLLSTKQLESRLLDILCKKNALSV
jgi:hypothetical protein